jgi:hypothetical protein
MAKVLEGIRKYAGGGGVKPWHFYPWPQECMGTFQHMTVFSKVKSKESVMQNDACTFIY